MGFIRAFAGALSGTFADQWKDFLIPPSDLSPTAAIFPAVASGQNAGRGSNISGSKNIITNGSQIVVPEGYGLATFQDGQLTGFINEPGGYLFTSEDQNSQSMFAADGIVSPTITTSWERFKFGGQPASQQLAFYINVKEIPDNRFGTQSVIYWDDSYLNTQVGAIARGSYSIRISDPILFIKQFVPLTFFNHDAKVFDFSDPTNAAASQLFNEFVGSLSAAFSLYTNDPNKANRIANIQRDTVGFGRAVRAAVEEDFHWKADRGIAIAKVALQSIDYDDDTRALLSDVKKADALSGGRGNSYIQQALARGLEATGSNPGGTGGGAGIAILGIGANAAAETGSLLRQQTPQTSQHNASEAASYENTPATPGLDVKLRQLKSLLDEGVISEADFEAAKRKELGI